MKKSLVIISLTAWSIIGMCQDKYYHLLDYTCASCPPSVFMWNVDKSHAVEFGDYVEEYTDSLQRAVKLLLYSNNKNKRAVIDDKDYVIYEYTDSTIVVIALISPQWWYPLSTTDLDNDYMYGSPTAERYTVKYDAKSIYHNVISSTYQTIRGWEYYATQLVENNYYTTYEQAYEYVRNHFIYTEKLDSSIRLFREPSETYVPYYSYSYCKNGIREPEPMGIIMRANRIY